MHESCKPEFAVRLSVHPATRLVLWLFYIGIVQCMDNPLPAFIILLFPFSRGRSLKRALILIKRARWLLISLFVIFAWGSTGRPLWNAYPAPTYEGLEEALRHSGRLMLVLVSIAFLLENLSSQDLLLASHTLFKPLRRMGLDARRGIVRLLLALRYAENFPHPKEWRTLLEIPVLTTDEWIEVNDAPLRWLDCSLIFSGILLVVMAFYFR